MNPEDKRFFEYCGKDGAVTYEISNYLDGALKGCSLAHYRLNMLLLNALLYMQLRGIRYDTIGAAERRADLLKKKYEAQARLNALTGFRFTWRSMTEIKERANSVMLTIKGDRPRKQYEESYETLQSQLGLPTPSLATIGEIEDLCEVSLNVDSKEFKTYLYETLGLPEQWKEDKATGRTSLTADYEALLKLSRHCVQKDKERELAIVQTAIEIRALATRANMLSIHADSDNRIRCGYNLVGSETGRITCYTSPTGSGYNLQTIPNYTNTKDAPGGVLGDRDLFVADEGFWFFQCDLSGADGWTYAAYAAMLGDSTMLDDYRYGLKPAKILALMLAGSRVDFSNRAELKEASKSVDKDDWAYFACKRVQHGSAYLEGKIVISRSILKDSEGKLFMEPEECEKLKRFYYTRYPGIPRWHNWTASKLKARPILTSASGQVRRFYGRPEELLTKAVAYEPQSNTTFATNLAMFKLWHDSENRTKSSIQLSDSRRIIPEIQERSNDQRKVSLLPVDSSLHASGLRIEPLHQVHDALCGQFRQEEVQWAAPRIRGYFDNPLQIAGQTIVIPYEGGYGTSWGSLTVGKL